MRRKPIDEVMPLNQIKVKVMCLIVNNGQILVARGRDTHAGKEYYRVLGGTLEFGEQAESGIRREIKEELGSEIENLVLVDVVENIFRHENREGHQITFLFKGDLIDKNIYEQNPVILQEENYDAVAEWIPVVKFSNGEAVLYPTYDYSKIFL